MTRSLLRLLLVGLALLSAGCIYVIPAVVAGAVIGSQTGKSSRNVVLVDQEADLLFARGPADTGSTPEGKGRTVVGLQLRVTATKDTRLDTLRFRATGSGDDRTLTQVSLYVDANSNARLDANERRLGTSTLFSADEGDALFSGLAEPLAAGASLDLLVVFDVPLDALDNQTHQVRLTQATDVGAVTTLASGETRAVEVLGLPIQGGVKTISGSGSLLLRTGPSAPASKTVFPNAQSVVVSQLELRTSSVEAIDVSSLSLTQAGSGQLQAQIARGDLYLDTNGDGLLDPNDVAIALNVAPTQNLLVFNNLAQVIPASGITQWLVVYTFNGAAPDGATFRPDIAQGGVSARGTSSGQAIGPTGLPLTSPTTTTVQRATLNVLAGPFPGGGQASPGQGSVPVLQLQLTAGPAEPVVITSLRVTGTGSGHEANDLSSARLFLDQNGDGATAGDPQIGQVLVYPSDNGSITFSGFQRELAAGATQFWVLVYDVGGAAGAGVDFRATTSPSADLGASGRTSALAITPGGGAITGGRLDVTGSLSLGPGPVPPPPASVLANEPNLPVLQLRLSAGVGEAIRLTSLTLRPSGAADDQADVQAVDLYRDVDSSGTVSAGDVLLASSTFPGDDQPVGFSNPAGLIPGDVPSGASRDLLVRYQLSGQAFQAETFQARVELADLTVIGASSGLTLTPGGSPVVGATMSVRRARLSVSTGPQNPGDTDALAGQPDVATLQVRVDVGPGEDVDLTSLTVRAAGTADDTADVANATLYLDRGTTLGAVDAGDLMLGTAQVFAADDGFVTFSAAPLTSLTAGTDHRLLVAYRISVTANTPRLFTTRTGGAADIGGSGRASGLSAQTLGASITGGTKTIRRGSLTLAAGANMPAATPVFPNAQNLSALQLALTAGFPESVQVNTVRVSASGSADEAQAATRLKLVLDQNGDGFAAASDPVLGTSAIADDGAVTFTLPATPAAGSLVVPAGQTRNLLCVYDLSGLTVPPGDLRLALVAPTEVTTTGLVSLQPIPPTGVAITGNQIPLQLGTLALSTTVANPSSSTVLRNAKDLALLQLRCDTGSVESVKVTSLRVTHTGSGTPAAGVNLARLYFDRNANGLLDADTQLATATFSGATATFTIPGGFDIASVESSHFLVLYELNATPSAGETFQLSLAANADLSAQGNSSGLPIPPTGAPLSGGLKTLVQASLGLASGAQAPTNRSVFRDEQDVAVLQLRLNAGPAEPVEVTSVRVTPTGSGDSSAQISRVRLYLEGDPADGVLNGDQLVGDFANYGGGPLSIAPITSVTVPAGGAKSLLLVVDHNAPAASAGATFGAQLQASSDVVARGVISADPVAPSGVPPAVGAQHTVQEASLTLSQGDAPVGDGTIAIVQTGVAILQAKLSAGPAEAVSVTSLSLTFQGSANPQTALSAVRLYRDSNDNGILDGDPLLATQTYSGAGTLSFSLAPGALIVPAAGFRHVLVAYDVGGSASDLQTFSARIVASSDLSGVGQSSGLSVAAAGSFPLAGATKTARERTLSIQAGPALPDRAVFANQSALPALTLRCTAGAGEGIRITSLTLRGDPAGSGDDTGIAVRLYRDQNADGVLDTGDVFLGTQTFAADPGVATFTISPSLDVVPAGSVNLLAVYDLPGTAADNTTFRLRFASTADVGAVGATSGASATFGGGPFPLAGALFTSRRSALALSAPTQVAPGEIVRNAQAVSMVRLRAAATGVEDVKLTSLTLRPDGAATGDPTQAQVRLFRDLNQNGTLEVSDLQLGSAQAGSATSVSFVNATGLLSVPAGSSLDLLVVWDFDGSPTPAQTFAARINAGDVAAIGSNTGTPVLVSGGPFVGGTQTVADPALSVVASPNLPSAGPAFPNASGVPTLALRLSAGSVETVRVTQVSIAALGSGNDATDLSALRLYRDDNANGVVDGDALLASASAYPSDDGTLSFAIPGGLLDLPANASRDLLLVYDFGPGATPGESFQARLTGAAAVAAQGRDSGIAAVLSGGPVTGGLKTIAVGSLSASAGPANPPATNRIRNAKTVPQLQLRLSAGAVEAVRLTQVVIRGSGSGSEVADVSSAALYLDDGDGLVSGGDTLLQSGVAYAGDDGTLTFSGLTLIVPAGASRDLLVSYDYAAAAAGGTFSARLQDPSADLSSSGVGSGAAINATGPSASGGTTTLVAATLSVAAGPANPGPRVIQKGATGVEVLQLRFSAGAVEGVRVTQVRLTPSGTGHDQQGVTQVSLYQDLNQNGLLDGDTLLASGAWPGDDAPASFPLTLSVPAGGSADLLAVINVAAVATASDTFTTRLALDADVSAQGLASGLSVAASGAPVAGGTQTITDTAAISVSQSLALPAGVANASSESVLLPLRLSETTGQAGVRLQSLVVRGAGSGDESSDVAFVRLYRDLGTPGVRDAADVQIGLSAYFVDEGLASFAGLSELVPASGALDLLVSYVFADGTQATSGETFAATIQVSGLTLVEVGSGQSITPSGLPQTGPLRTILSPTLSALAGPNNPGALAASPGEADVELLQFSLSANQAGGGTVAGLTLSASGSGDETTGVAAASLYVDQDGDGRVGPGDRLIQRLSAPFGADNGDATFTLSEAIATSASVTWLVAYELTAAPSAGQTFSLALTAVNAGSVALTGLPVAGGTLSLAGTLRLEQGGAPPRRVLAIPSSGEAAALIRLRADSAEAWTLSALILTASGSADDLGDVGNLSLFLDDGDGVYEPGADDGAALASAPFANNDGQALLSGLALGVPAGGSRSLWVALDVSGAATPGRSFRVSLMDGSLVVAAGDATGSTRILGGRVDGAALDLGVSASLFGAASTAALGSAEAVLDLVTGDLDRDGDQDFVALRADGRLEVRLNTGAGAAFSLKGTFAGGTPLSPQRLLVGDLDRDGWPDVLVIYAASVSLLTNQGSADPGNLNPPVDYPDAGADYREGVLVDYERDGDLDLVLIDRGAPRLRGRRNDGSGGLAALDALTLPSPPRRLCAGDFDRDGRVDLAWSDDAGQVRSARGSGSFFALDDVDAGAASGALLALDLDRDGDLDLLAVDAAGDALLPFANAGGAFSAAPSQPSAPGLTQTAPGDAVAADLDGNGLSDFLLPHAGLDGLVARISSASLSLPSGGASAYAAGLDPDRIASADLNGDGDPDALVGSTALAGQVQILLGEGQTKGSLASLSSASVLAARDFARALASADLDRDGRPDLLAAGATTLSLFLRSSALGYAAAAETTLAGAAGGLVVGDLDRDGALDVVVTIRSLAQDRVDVYRGKGDGTLLPPISALCAGDTNPGPLALCDKDRDGVLDALVAESSGLQLYRGNGVSLGNALSGDAYPTPSEPRALALADLDRDGRADVAAVCSGGTLEVRLGGAGFAFGAATSTPLAAAIGTPVALGLADLDRDGRLDLVVAGSGGLEVFQGDGAGGFTSQSLSTLQAGLSGLALLDLDKDGDLDLVAPHGAGWALYLGSGGFVFAAPVTQTSSGGAGLRGVVSVDLDGDGDSDLAFGSERRELQHALGR